MDLHKILDSIYIIPVLLEHLEKPTRTTTQILLTNGIGPKEIEECSKVKHLLEYHYNIIAYNYTAKYDLLRQGLTEYFNEHLSVMFQKLGLVGLSTYALDYGCGSGQVMEQFLKDNPNSKGLMVDRSDNGKKGFQKIDFETNPNWYRLHVKAFGVVILSEVLHCKTPVIQQYLIDTSEMMLKNKGSLVIVENVDYCMEYRISKIKQNDFRVLNEWHVRELMEGTNFIQTNMITINRHNIYEFTKVR